jgi:hypothetical protein
MMIMPRRTIYSADYTKIILKIKTHGRILMIEKPKNEVDDEVPEVDGLVGVCHPQQGEDQQHAQHRPHQVRYHH